MLRSPFQASLILLTLHSVSAADWPLVRGDAERSGRTNSALPAELVPLWSFQPAHAPSPAWPREPRMLFDRAQHVVAAQGKVFFGSSTTSTVTALEAATGDVLWTTFTDAPVRFAPAIWKDRLYVVSDDGYLRALSLADGSLLAKWKGGPEADSALGNGRIVDRYPARGGPVIRDNILYWVAGIWQSEGIFITALDLETEQVLWVNDTSGAIYMPQPHGGANAESGVTVQGYLVATQDHLIVPTGRAVPAVFDRKTGEFQYYHLQKFGQQGGSDVMAAGEEFFNIGADYSGTIFAAKTGEAVARLQPGAYAALPEGVLHAGPKGMQFLKRGIGKVKDRRGEEVDAVQYAKDWELTGVVGGQALLVAGNLAVAASSESLTTVDLNTREVVWSTKVESTPYGLATADGRLFVSTEDGAIHCFAASGGSRRVTGDWLASEQERQELLNRWITPEIAAAAETILRDSGVDAGYCVDLGCGDGALAAALAMRSDLHLVAIETSAEQVAHAREKLLATGLYGSRVTVLQRDPADTQLPKYVFNLVTSRNSLTAGVAAVNETEATRLQRPSGGVACLGPVGEMLVTVRPAVANSGTWTHQYTDPANTGSTPDEVKGPLRVLWYNDIPLEIPQRHGRGPAPLYFEGRMFVMGMDEMLAADAYNGRVLWRFPLPGALRAYDADHLMGTAGTGSNFCVSEDSVYVRHEGVAYRLNAATGEVLRKFTPPHSDAKKVPTWGYIACRDGILFGSSANEEHVVVHGWRPADMSRLFTESKNLFAFDVHTGELLWEYVAQESIRHNAIAIAEDKVFLIDRALAKGDLLSNEAARRGKDAPTFEHPTGTLIKLNSRTGEVEWKNEEDVWGTVLAYQQDQDLLMMGYQSTRFKLPSEVGGRLAVFQGVDGYRLWEREAKYTTRPLILGQTILAEGGKWDLQTGDNLPFDFSRSYGCGQLAASKNLLLFRSATFGYVDLSSPETKTQSYGGVRPGCWINALPVGGLVLLPDASAGCVCSYQNRSWMALQGTD